MTRKASVKRNFNAIEREALLESIRHLERQVYEKDLALTQLRREVVALRLMVSIHRVQDDPRIHTSTSRDEEMGDLIFQILEGREVEMMDYEAAKEAYESMKNQPTPVRTYE